MWILNKPDTAKALTEDIDSLVAHCNGLDDTHKPLLKKLYHEYDNNGGYATNVQLTPLAPKKSIILGQYTSKMTGSQNLAYVRRELNSGITTCPMCGINEPNTLDHFMDKSDYGQLACCRLNLVPACGICNGKKHNKPYNHFVHAYYDRYPDVEFLKTSVTVRNNKLGYIFSIDKVALGNTPLANKTESQFDKLELNSRFHKTCNSYVTDYIKGLTCKTDKALRILLNNKYRQNLNKYGRNHWKTSVINGLLNCATFDMNVVGAIKARTTKIENGAGA